MLDLDGPRELLHRGLRPTQILARNLAVTQQWGHDIWGEKDPGDPSSRRWQGVAWWSYHRPTWQVLASWKQPELVHIEPLDLSHPAVADAAGALRRPLMM